MATKQEAAKELLARRKGRRGFADFCRYTTPEEPPAEHHELICDIGDRIINGTCKRAMFFMPPGSAKSTYATVRFPAYLPLAIRSSSSSDISPVTLTTAVVFCSIRSEYP